MEVSVFGLLLGSLVPLSSCSYRGSTSCGPSSGKGTTACVWQDMSFRLLNLQKAAFLSPLYSCREFQSKMFLRQHWSISSSAGTSCFAYVVCLQASHCPLLSLPCLEWILLFAPLVSMRSVHEGKCNSPSVTQKKPSQTLNSLHGWISRWFPRMKIKIFCGFQQILRFCCQDIFSRYLIRYGKCIIMKRTYWNRQVFVSLGAGVQRDFEFRKHETSFTYA